MKRAPLILASVAALMGAAGVALAAAGVHENGGELVLRSSRFLLLHACAALAIAAHAKVATAPARALAIVGFAMEAGATLFSAELAFHAFTGVGAFRFAAPVGGTTMLVAWITLAVVFATSGRAR